MKTAVKRAVSLDGLPDFCSLEEFAEVFQVSRSTAYRMAARGMVPCLRIGSRIIMSREHLRLWVNEAINCSQKGVG